MPTPNNTQLTADVKDLVDALAKTTKAFDTTNTAIKNMMTNYAGLSKQSTQTVTDLVSLTNQLGKVASQSQKAFQSIGNIKLPRSQVNDFKDLFRTFFDSAGLIGKDAEKFLDRIVLDFGDKLKKGSTKAHLTTLVSNALGLSNTDTQFKSRREVKLDLDIRNFKEKMDQAFTIMQQDDRFKKGVKIALAPDLTKFSNRDQERVTKAVEKLGNAFATGNIEFQRAAQIIDEVKKRAASIQVKTTGEKNLRNSLIEIRDLVEQVRLKAGNLQIDQKKFDAVKNSLNSLNINPTGAPKLGRAIEDLATKAAKSKLSLQELQDILTRFQQNQSLTSTNQRETPIIKGLEKIKSLSDDSEQKLKRLQIVASGVTLKQLEFKGIKIPPNLAGQVQPFIDKINNAIAAGLSTNQLDKVIDSVKKGGTTAFTGLEQQAATAVRGINEQLNKLPGLFGFLESSGKRFLQVLGTLAVFDLGRSTIFAFINALKQASADAIQFGIKVAEVQTITQTRTQATTVQFQLLSAEITNMALAMGQPLQDVTKGLYDTFSNQVAKGTENLFFMNEALKFSKVTVSSTADSVNLLSGALVSFGLNTLNAERVAAIFFKTIDLGRVTATELAPSFGRIGNLAATLNIPLEELAVAMQVLTVRGVTADEAMTLLNNIMLKLLKPTEDMDRLFKRIGVSTGEAAVNAFGFRGVLQIVEQEAKKGSKELSGLFNELRALRGAAVFSSDGMEDFNNNLKETTNSAQAYKNAIQIILTNTQQKLQIELQKVNTFLTQEFGLGISKGVLTAVEAFGGLDKVLKVILTVTKALVIAGGAYVAVLGLQAIYTAGLTKNIATLTVAFNGLSSAFGIRILAVAATAAFVALGLSIKSTEEKIVEFEREVDRKNKDILSNNRQRLLTEQEDLRKNIDSKFQAISKYTADVVRLNNRAGDLATQAYKRSTDGIKTTLQSVTDALQRQISALEKSAQKAEQFVEKARQAAFDRPGQFFEEQIDDSLKRMQRQEQQLLSRADPLSQNAIKADFIQKKMDVLAQSLNRISLEFKDVAKFEDYEKLDQTFNKFKARLTEITELELELADLQGRAIPDAVRPKVLSFERDGKVKDATDDFTKGNTGLVKLGEAINVNNLRNISSSTILRDLEAERLRITEQLTKVKEAQAANDRRVAEEQKKLLRDTQNAIESLTNFKFLKEDGKPKTRAQVEEEVTKAKQLISTALQDAPVADKLAAATKLQELETNIFRKAEADRTAIQLAEFQARQNNIKTQLQAQTQAVPETIQKTSDVVLTRIKEIESGLITTFLTLKGFGFEAPALLTKAVGEFDQAAERIRQSVKDRKIVDPADLAQMQIAINTLDQLISKTQVTKRTKVEGARNDKFLDLDFPFSKERIGELGTVEDVLKRVKIAMEDIGKAGTEQNTAVDNLRKLREEMQALSLQAGQLPLTFEQRLGLILGMFAESGGAIGAAQAFATSFRDLGENLKEPNTQLGNLNLELSKMLLNLEKLKSQSIKINIESAAAGGGFFGFAKGGRISPPAGDNMLAWFNRDEFVVNARDTKKFLPQLMSMNRGIEPTFNNSSESVTVGDIHVHVKKASDVDAQLLGRKLQRLVRRGNLRLRGK